MSPIVAVGGVPDLSERLWHRHGSRVVIPEPLDHVQFRAASRGPQTRPLLWTALRKSPSRLSWTDAPPSTEYELVVSTGEASVSARGPKPDFKLGSVARLPKATPINWSIAAVDRCAARVEGRFWLLDDATLDRLRSVEDIVASIDDSEIRAVAQALACAEVGLYDEAIGVLDALTALRPRSGRAAIVHRAFVAILQDMEEKRSADANEAVTDWIEARLRNHSAELARALPTRMAGVPRELVRNYRKRQEQSVASAA